MLDQIEQGGAEYVIPVGRAAPRRARRRRRSRQALAALRRRHDVLRTTFVAEQGRPVAVVRDDADVELLVTRPSGGARTDREAAAREAAAAEIRRPFDLAAGPLLRARLFAVDGDDHLLVLALHHIVADGWTVGVILRELGALYAASGARGEPPPRRRLATPRTRAGSAGGWRVSSSIASSLTGGAASKARPRSSAWPRTGRALRRRATGGPGGGRSSPRPRRARSPRSRFATA